MYQSNDIDWSDRFSIQAQWTYDLRQYTYEKINLKDQHSLLEVGCGTGTILKDIANNFSLNGFGLDINKDFINIAISSIPKYQFTLADAYQIPFFNTYFDITFCHYFLMWLKNPHKVVQEMKRVTRRGGYIIAFAEPDYGKRIDFPNELCTIGDLQAKALRERGANPNIGRELSSIFSRCGLRTIEAGVLGGKWSPFISEKSLQSEWSMIYVDLKDYLPSEKLDELYELDLASWKANLRTLFVPTFYAIGQVTKK
jgi:ubiquinone/menaquinone biosynthesis C-methylase UbiE